MEGSHQRYGRGPREWKMALSRRESKDEMGTPGKAKRIGIGLGAHGAMASFRSENG